MKKFNMIDEEFICENCGKEHDGSYGSGRFCSKECAKGFSGKQSGPGIIYDTCNCCGKKILIKKHSSKSSRLCDECKQNVNTTNYTTNTCKICGRRLIKRQTCKNDFCKKHSLKQIRTLIKYFGFDESYVGTKDVEQEFNRVRQILYSLYWDECLCGEEISQLYGYKNSHNLTQSIFKYLEIPTRNKIKDFLQNSIFTGRFKPAAIETCYKTTWHTTWENKEVFLNIELINEAIKQRKKITFEYLSYDENGKLSTRRKGYKYKVSPYFLINNFNKYYLLCNIDRFDNHANFRVEYMTNINILDDDIKPYKEVKTLGEKFDIIILHKRASENIFTHAYAITAVIRFGRKCTNYA